MPDRVIDASALAAVLFEEDESELVVQQLGGARLIAPDLIDYELANVCWLKCRRHPEQRERLVASFRLRSRLKVHTSGVDHVAIAVLALETGLTAYDASYLWLAMQTGAELVTLDRALSRQAASRGLTEV